MRTPAQHFEVLCAPGRVWHLSCGRPDFLEQAKQRECPAISSQITFQFVLEVWHRITYSRLQSLTDIRRVVEADLGGRHEWHGGLHDRG